MGRPALDVKTRLESNRLIDVATGCWIWTAGRVSRKRPLQTYGRINVKGVPSFVHREAYRAYVSPDLKGLCVLHRCDNPPCFNPDHLFLGTKGDNNRDTVSKKRQPKMQRTNCAKGHPLSGSNLGMHGGGRRCLTCHREQERARMLRKLHGLK